MARRGGETISELFLSLGLDISQLESDFIAADRNVNEAMARLRRQSTLIDLRARVELEGLNEATDGARRLAVQEQALNERLSVQRDRIRITEAALQSLQRSRNQDRAAIQRAEVALERERLALAELENELRNLSDAQDDAADGTGNLTDAIMDFIATRAPAIATLIGIAESASTVKEAINEMLDDFNELQKQSYELNLDVGDTESFLRHMKLAGGDIGDFEGYIRGISDAFVKGEADDPEFLALSRYGAQLTDASGRLKNFQELTEEVYQAFKKAEAEGNEIEFLQLTGGEAGVRDAIQYFRRYEEAKEDAAKIFDANLDFDELHALDREMKLLNEQTNEFKQALTNLITPMARSVIEWLFEKVRDGTQLLVESTDKVQRWGFMLESAAERLGKVFDFNGFEGLDFGDAAKNEQWAQIRAGIEVEGERSVWEKARDKFLDDLLGDMDRDAKVKQAEYKFKLGAKAEVEPSEVPTMEDFFKDLEADLSKQKVEPPSDTSDILSQYASKRISDYRRELEDLRIELEHGGNEYEKSKAELEKWRERETTNKLYLSKEEDTAIEELYAAKSEQIEQERADKLDEIREKIAAADRTALENKLAAIESEKDEWISAGMDEAEAALSAEKQKQQAILELEKEFEQSRAELGQSGLEQTLARIEREKEAWKQKGIEEARAAEHAEQAKAEAQRNAALTALKSQLKEMRAFNEGGYGGLQEYYRSELYRQGVKREELMLTPEQLNAFEQARQMATKSLLPNFMTAQEREQNAELESKWLEGYRQKVNEVKGYAIGDDGKVMFMTKGTPHRQPYDEKGKPDEAREYQLGVDERLKQYYGKDRLTDSLDGLNIGEKLNEQLQRDLSRLEIPVDKLNSELENINTPVMSPESNLRRSSSKTGLDTETGVERVYEPLSPLKIDADVEPIKAPTEIEPVVLGAMEEYGSPLDSLTAMLEGLTEPLSMASDKLWAFLEPLETMTAKLLDLASRLSEEVLPEVKASPTQSEPAPVQNTITTNVSIEEAHAWDVDHIQELAERVADVIQPALVEAISGGRNGY
ncbi:MAG: hypothetical protein IJ668_00030 [Selenomonadaceae bacterium]|nr:hypothetical protein [Selenomonadaceae bacterium]